MLTRLLSIFLSLLILSCSSNSIAKNEVAAIESTEVVEFGLTGDRIINQIKKHDDYYIFEFNLAYKNLPLIYNGINKLTKASYSCEALSSKHSRCYIYSDSLTYTLINKKIHKKEIIKISTQTLAE